MLKKTRSRSLWITAATNDADSAQNAWNDNTSVLWVIPVLRSKKKWSLGSDKELDQRLMGVSLPACSFEELQNRVVVELVELVCLQWHDVLYTIYIKLVNCSRRVSEAAKMALEVEGKLESLRD